MLSEPAPSLVPPPSQVAFVDRVVECVPVAILAAVPTFLRARSLNGDAELAFSAFALAAVVTVPAAFLFLAALRRASESLRQLAGESPIAGAGVGLMVATTTLALWEKAAATLAHVTHHRGLGGVAFAAVAAITAFGAAVLARKLLRALVAQGTTFATFAGVASFFAPVVLCLSLPPVQAPAGDVLGLFVVDVLGLIVIGGGWLEHLAPAAWPVRARLMVGAGALLLVLGSLPVIRGASEWPLASAAFAFRFLPLR